jgi:oxygen-independent coproporphyrinogen III oxidase
MFDSSLIKKYNVPGPRYTSYPTVPYWDQTAPDAGLWTNNVKFTFDKTEPANGIALYIHLPFCESLCTYCGCNTRITVNHRVEEVYIMAVLKEWKMYVDIFGRKPKIRELHLGGGTPTFFSPENLQTLISGILEDAEVHPQHNFSFEAHPNNTSEKHLRTLYQLGFRRLSLGIQDFDEKVQEMVNRIQPYQKVANIVNQARAIGYTSVNFDLIYGLPLQTIQSVESTIQKVIELLPDRIAFYGYAHVPWIKQGQRKFTEADLPVDAEKRALYEMGKKLFLMNDYEEIGMDHFALKTDSLYRATQNGELHRNFMGYTESRTKLMVGLGVSSISDTWTVFAQNVKTVEGYYEKLERNELPIFKGHTLNEEDLIMRRHILNLICKFETTWEKETEQCEAMYEAIDRLKEMVYDELVILEPYKLTVSKEAIPFIRNACMAFDARLWKNLPQSKIFSNVV